MIYVGILLVVFAWWAAGIASFVYDWTYEFDMTRKDLAVGIFAGGCAGPFLGLWCWYWYWRRRSPWTPTNLHPSHAVMRQRVPRVRAE